VVSEEFDGTAASGLEAEGTAGFRDVAALGAEIGAEVAFVRIGRGLRLGGGG